MEQSNPPAEVRLSEGLGRTLETLDRLWPNAAPWKGNEAISVVALPKLLADERERCACRLDVASAEYTASATENKYLTERGREMMLQAADWAENMARCIRGLAP